MLRLFLAFAGLFVLLLSSIAQPLPGRVIVEWEKGIAPADLIGSWNASRMRGEVIFEERTLSARLPASLLLVEPPPADPDAWLQAFRKMPGVKAAQWDQRLVFTAIPDDPKYPQQWSLPHIGTDRVWEATTGGLTATGDTIVVAILDGGFDLAHPDLAGNIWVNREEVPGDGIDNDGNGYIDDLHGWNFADESPEHPMDLHGTAVAGIIGAVGNNDQGIAGINWQLKMLLCTTSNVSDVIQAYEYIIDQRERFHSSRGEAGALVVVTNASFGLSEVFCEEQAVWGAMYDLLGKSGILTAAATSNTPADIDEVGDMPSTCPSPFLISVLNTTIFDEKEASSGFGVRSVDIGAPGSGILSTHPSDKYGNFNGTSAATPHVCGAIALLYSQPCTDFALSIRQAPQQTALTVKEALLKGALPIPALEGLSTTGGRLCISKSMDILQEQCQLPDQNVLQILNLFPNPAHDGIEVTYHAHDQKRISWQVINYAGQVIRKEALGINPWTIKRFYMPRLDLPNGIYLLVLTDGQNQVSQPFVLY